MTEDPGQILRFTLPSPGMKRENRNFALFICITYAISIVYGSLFFFLSPWLMLMVTGSLFFPLFVVLSVLFFACFFIPRLLVIDPPRGRVRTWWLFVPLGAPRAIEGIVRIDWCTRKLRVLGNYWKWEYYDIFESYLVSRGFPSLLLQYTESVAPGKRLAAEIARALGVPLVERVTPGEED